MAKVTASVRAKLPTSAFADPTDRKFLIHDKTHAELAWALASKHAWPSAPRKASAKARITAALQRFGVDSPAAELPEIQTMSMDMLSALHGMMECDFGNPGDDTHPDAATYSADLAGFLPELAEAPEMADIEAEAGCCSDVLEDRFLKIPVARLGVWTHPVYGMVSFTPDDFTQMMANFENDELGFPPYARYGHDLGKPGVNDDEPSRGQIVGLAQEGPILFSYVRPDDPYMVEDVEAKRMNYASAEVFRKQLSKIGGKPIGTLLKAIALTNSPFVPNLPANQVLSQSEPKRKVETMIDALKQLFSQGLALLSAEPAETTQETAKTVENDASNLTHGDTVPDDVNTGGDPLKTAELALVELNAGDTASEEAETLDESTEDSGQTPAAADEAADDAIDADTAGEMTPEETDMSEQNTAQQTLIEELSNRLNALEASNVDLIEKFSTSAAENEQLKTDLTATKAMLNVTTATAEQFSANLAAEKRTQLQNQLVSEGIPPAMVEQAFSFAAGFGTNEMKLSDGAVGNVDEQVAVMLRAMPKESRIQFGQAGHQLSMGGGSTETAASIYGDLVPTKKA